MANTNRQEILLGANTYRKPSEMKVGDEVSGIYAGTKPDNYGGVTHFFTTGEGSIGVNGTGSLNKKLSQVAIGSNITIQYDGKEKMESGKYKGKEVHNFRVFKNDGSAPAAPAPKAAPKPDTSDNDEF